MIELRTTLNLYDSQNALFSDVTGDTAPYAYNKDGNIEIGVIDSIRLLMANYTTLTNKATLNENDVFVAFNQYIKVSGTPSAINNKTFDVGALFVPQFENIEVPVGDVWETTGYYVPNLVDNTVSPKWIPSSFAPLNLNVTQLGGQANSDIDQNIWAYQYEIYFNELNNTFAAKNGTQYMVINFGSATYGGDTYYAGEVFTATDTSNIATSNSGVYVSELYGNSYAYSPLLCGIKTDLNDAIERQIGKNNQDLVNIPETEIQKIRNIVESLEYASFTGNVSLSYCYETIQYIQSRLTLLLA